MARLQRGYNDASASAAPLALAPDDLGPTAHVTTTPQAGDAPQGLPSGIGAGGFRGSPADTAASWSPLP